MSNDYFLDRLHFWELLSVRNLPRSIQVPRLWVWAPAQAMWVPAAVTASLTVHQWREAYQMRGIPTALLKVPHAA